MGVSVGGTRVLVRVFVGFGVLVEVGKLVSVGVGVSVGLGVKELQDANAMTRTKIKIALPMVFIYFLALVLTFYDKPSTIGCCCFICGFVYFPDRWNEAFVHASRLAYISHHLSNRRDDDLRIMHGDKVVGCVGDHEDTLR